MLHEDFIRIQSACGGRLIQFKPIKCATMFSLVPLFSLILLLCTQLARVGISVISDVGPISCVLTEQRLGHSTVFKGGVVNEQSQVQ